MAVRGDLGGREMFSRKSRVRLWFAGAGFFLAACSLLFSLLPVNGATAVYGAEAVGAPGQNPPLDVINQKLETIARQKGIPPVLLKAIAYKESAWRQWDSAGNVVRGGNDPHPALGIMQVASYNDADLATVERLKTDIDFNIATGADLLNEKWAMVPRIGDGDRNKLENWYFALWAYNSWSDKNNPRTLSQSGQGQAYQDKILAICAQPPDFLPRFLPPVAITRLPVELLPASGVPAPGSRWETPQPVHYGGLLASPAPQRLAGSDRIDTAIRQARQGWPQGAAAVVLARADDFPDALAGAPLAAQLDAPILLTSPKSLDSRVLAALQQLHPAKVYLLGGEGALSPQITAALAANGWEAAKQVRLAGADRFATAAAIATALSGPVSTVFLANGQGFADALAVAGVAGALRSPVLLTDKNELPGATQALLQQLAPAQVYLVGGSGVISQAVAGSVQSLLNLPPQAVSRLAGTDRYGTMAAVAERFGQTAGVLDIASGDDFPDALAGAPLAVRQQGFLTLLPGDSLARHPELKAYLARQWPGLTQVYILGGEGAVSKAREAELTALGS